MNNSIKMLLAASTLALVVPAAARADEVTDTLNSAIAAYEEGDIAYALDELEYAKQLMSAMKADALQAYLPDAPQGWSREIGTDNDMAMAMSMLGGGGTAATATYSNGDQDFTVTIMVDSPMMAMMGGMIANAAAMGLPIIRVGREKFIEQDGDLFALIGGRVMVQVTGDADRDVVVETLKNIDYRGLKSFEG